MACPRSNSVRYLPARPEFSLFKAQPPSLFKHLNRLRHPCLSSGFQPIADPRAHRLASVCWPLPLQLAFKTWVTIDLPSYAARLQSRLLFTSAFVGGDTLQLAQSYYDTTCPHACGRGSSFSKPGVHEKGLTHQKKPHPANAFQTFWEICPRYRVLAVCCLPLLRLEALFLQPLPVAGIYHVV